jgi:hypothetical protein
VEEKFKPAYLFGDDNTALSLIIEESGEDFVLRVYAWLYIMDLKDIYVSIVYGSCSYFKLFMSKSNSNFSTTSLLHRFFFF